MNPLLTPRDWQAQAQREGNELLGTPEGAAKLVEAKRYGMLVDEIDRLIAKLSPVLLTENEIAVLVDGYRFHNPEVRQSHIARAIESAVLKKNGILA